jgi:hypothetical protein
VAKRTRPTVPAEHKIAALGGDLAQTLRAAREKAEGWLSQKQHIARHLESIRDTAGSLLEQMGHGAPAGRSAGSNVRQVTIVTGQSNNLRKPSTISAEGRARIAEAQRKRWAALKAGQK